MNPLNQRIFDLIAHLGLNKTSFAQEIGVSQPVITHVTNGRNKPGIELLQKILHRYPDLNAEWLLTGKGKVKKEQHNHEREQLLSQLLAEMEIKVQSARLDLESLQNVLNIIKDQQEKSS